MQNWQVWVDTKIREVIGDGNVSHLPGAGQPMNLDGDDDFISPELRLAYRIMKDNDVAPPWASLGMELDDELELILKRADAYARDYVGRLADARRAGSAIMERDADERYDAAIARLRKQIEKYNSKLLIYNTSVPAVIGQKPMLIADQVIEAARARYR